MAKAPAFQFYANDFITGTQDWSIEEVGIYIRLLCYQWDHGFIPENKNRLARIAGCDKEAIEKAWVILGYKFLPFPEGLKNARLERTREDQIKFREKQYLNGSKGGRPIKTETQTKPKNNPTVNPNHNPKITSSSSPSNKENIIKKIEFLIFWNLYSKKRGDKDRCEKKWDKLTLEIQEKIIETVPQFISQFSDITFQPFPETYLNQKRWNDELKTEPKKEAPLVYRNTYMDHK